MLPHTADPRSLVCGHERHATNKHHLHLRAPHATNNARSAFCYWGRGGRFVGDLTCAPMVESGEVHSSRRARGHPFNSSKNLPRGQFFAVSSACPRLVARDYKCRMPMQHQFLVSKSAFARFCLFHQVLMIHIHPRLVSRHPTASRAFACTFKGADFSDQVDAAQAITLAAEVFLCLPTRTDFHKPQTVHPSLTSLACTLCWSSHMHLMWSMGKAGTHRANIEYAVVSSSIHRPFLSYLT